MNIEGDVHSSRAEKALSYSLAFLYMQSHILSCQRCICNTAVIYMLPVYPQSSAQTIVLNQCMSMLVYRKKGHTCASTLSSKGIHWHAK